MIVYTSIMLRATGQISEILVHYSIILEPHAVRTWAPIHALMAMPLVLAASSFAQRAMSLPTAARRLAPLVHRAQTRSYLREGESIQTVDIIDLTFLGTASGSPSMSRNQQALAMHLCDTTWLFDCGEASQHRMMRTTISPPDISRVFISHLHGDHLFGLPGMLCQISLAYGGGQDGDTRAEQHKQEQPLVIVGPLGLRSWLRMALGNSYTTLGKMKITIHELVGMAAMEGRGAKPPPYVVNEPLRNEVGGEIIEPDEDGLWRIPMRPTDPPMTVEAVELVTTRQLEATPNRPELPQTALSRPKLSHGSRRGTADPLALRRARGRSPVRRATRCRQLGGF